MYLNRIDPILPGDLIKELHNLNERQTSMLQWLSPVHVWLPAIILNNVLGNDQNVGRRLFIFQEGRRVGIVRETTDARRQHFVQNTQHLVIFLLLR